jgi:uncharacterized protein YdhG (YjbR/CyaY superfamily)
MAAKKVTGTADEVTAYLQQSPTDGQQRYALVRTEVLGQAGAERVGERLSYKMPTFFVDGRVLLHVGLWDEHLAIYPVPDSTTDAALADDLAPHRKSKGTLHFPYAEPWPAELIARIVAAHLERRT